MLRSANQATSSSQMKKTFIVLCILLCFVSVLLYSNPAFNWQAFNTIISHNFIQIASLNDNYTVIPLVNKSDVSSTIITNSVTEKKSSLPPHENRRFAIFACSIHATVAAYTFYTPLTAASWKRIGYEAIVVFVGDFTKPNVLTARLNISRNYLKHVGAHIVDLQCNESYSIKLSQLARVFSGFLPDTIVQDDDNILTGDSDLMPLKASEYQPTPGTNGFIFNAFCCGQFDRRGKSYTMYPMGHVFLQKKAWRAMVLESKQRAELLTNATDQQTKELLSENAKLSFEMITIYSRHEFKNVYDQRMDKGDAAWYMDQILCSMLIADYQEKHKNFTLSKRGRADRLDRAYGMNFWDRDKFDQFGDAHLKHDEILQESNWKIFNKLLKALFNETVVNLFNDYHKQYMIADKLPETKQQRRRR